MSEGSETSKAAALFGVLQSAGNIKHFVLSAAFLFFTDSALLQTGQMGLARMLAPNAALDAGLYLKIVIVLIAFSFYVSVAVIFFAVIFQPLWIELWHGLLNKILSPLSSMKRSDAATSRRFQRPYKCVSFGELRSAAHERKEPYLLKLLEAQEQRQDAADNIERDLSLYGLAALIAYCWNYWSFGQDSICVYLLRILDMPVTYWFLPAVFFFYVAIRRFHVESQQWVYCPTLNRELDEQERLARGEPMHAFMPRPVRHGASGEAD